MGLFRKIIKIKAESSPNVRFALAQIEAGLEPTGETKVPGVLGYAEYRKRRQTWSEIRQCIGLDAEFYEGREVLLFPPSWLNRAEFIARSLSGRPRGVQAGRQVAMGVDPAEGGDKTTMCVIDELGVLEMMSQRTPDTSHIPNLALALMLKWQVPPQRVAFDRGGGGKQAADRLRSMGHPVQTVAFGEGATPAVNTQTPSLRRRDAKIDAAEERYVYRNRRSELYGELRRLLDPARSDEGGPSSHGFGIPAELVTLRKELDPIPLVFDSEGRLDLPPKHRRGGQGRTSTSGSEKKTLVELIGHSPDEADALVLAVYALSHVETRPSVRAIGRSGSANKGSSRKAGRRSDVLSNARVWTAGGLGGGV